MLSSNDIAIPVALNLAIKLLEKGAGMLSQQAGLMTQQADLMTQQVDVLKGVLKKRKTAAAEEDFTAEDSGSSIKKTVKVVEKRVPVNTVYLTFNGRKPDRAPVTLTFLRSASVSQLYFKGIWIPEYDADDSFKPAVFPDRGRKFRSEVCDYIDGYDIDDVTFGNEDGDVAKPLKVCF